MNRRVLFWVFVVVGIFYVLAETPLVSNLFTLLILGMVPGTDLALPPIVMMIAYTLGFFGAVYWLAHQTLFVAEPVKPTKPVKQAAKKTAKKSTTSKKTTATKRRRARATV